MILIILFLVFGGFNYLLESQIVFELTHPELVSKKERLYSIVEKVMTLWVILALSFGLFHIGWGFGRIVGVSLNVSAKSMGLPIIFSLDIFMIFFFLRALLGACIIYIPLFILVVIIVGGTFLFMYVLESIADKIHYFRLRSKSEFNEKT